MGQLAVRSNEEKNLRSGTAVRITLEAPTGAALATAANRCESEIWKT